MDRPADVSSGRQGNPHYDLFAGFVCVVEGLCPEPSASPNTWLSPQSGNGNNQRGVDTFDIHNCEMVFLLSAIAQANHLAAHYQLRAYVLKQRGQVRTNHILQGKCDRRSVVDPMFMHLALPGRDGR